MLLFTCFKREEALIRRADRAALASERGNCAPVMPKAHNDSACKYSEINRIPHGMNLKRRKVPIAHRQVALFMNFKDSQLRDYLRMMTSMPMVH